MTKRNETLRDALRRIEAKAADALAHQPDGDADCHAHLMDALKSITDDAADTVCEMLGLRQDDFTAPRRGAQERKPPRQKSKLSPANLERTA